MLALLPVAAEPGEALGYPPSSPSAECLMLAECEAQWLVRHAGLGGVMQ